MSLRQRALAFWREVRSHPPVAPPADFTPRLPSDDAEELHVEDPGEAPPGWPVEQVSGHTVVIRYRDSKGQESERQLTCRRLEHRGGQTYLHAFCFSRQRLRCFRADRIASVIDPSTGEVFNPGSRFLDLFAPDSESAAPFRYGLSPAAYADLNAALNVLAFVARCDGAWHPLEKEAIEEFVTSYWLRAEHPCSLDLDDVTLHAARLAPDAETFWASLLRCSRHPVLAPIIRRHIGAVIDADGVHHPTEIYWAGEISDFLSEGV